MGEHVYKMIPVDQIKVLNSRNRDKDRFQENVRSIRDVGLLKPVVVNGRHFEKSGHYELVCGEGRYIAYKELQRTKIPAEVINCDRKTALLYSLVENIARVPPRTMWFAREVHRMSLEGVPLEDICKIVGKCDTYVRDYIRLAEQGEERLIHGVEHGLFNMTFALMVARSDDSTIQHVLMDAFDKGIVTSANLSTVRRVIEARLHMRARHDEKSSGPDHRATAYSLKQLKSDIQKITKEKESFVHEVSVKENRLITLLQDINALWQNEAFASLVQAEGLDRRPELKGTYAV
jgi:ParB family chromosome partitioning protein